jgi:hypothetical protein
MKPITQREADRLRENLLNIVRFLPIDQVQRLDTIVQLVFLGRIITSPAPKHPANGDCPVCGIGMGHS